MKRIFLYIAILFVLIFLFFCSTVNKIPSPKEKLAIDSLSFLEMVKTLSVTPEDLKFLDKSEKKFWEVVQLILKSDFSLVEQKCREILVSDVSNRFRFEYLKFLTYSLFYQSKWAELIPSQNTFYYDPDSVFLLAKVFAKVEPQSVVFSKNVDTIEFETAPNGAIILKVFVNGKQRNFWFDTGTNYTIVSSKTAEDCNLPILSKETSKAVTHTEYKVDVRPTFIQSLRLGNLEILNHPSLVVDDYNLKLRLIASNVPVEIYGIVGWKTIQNAKFTINYQKRIMIIEKPEKEFRNYPNFFWFGVPIVIGKFKNQQLLFILDIGAEKSYLTQNIFKKIDFQKVYEQTKQIGSVGGWKFNPTVVIPYFEVYFDSVKISFKDIGTIDFKKDYFFEIDGIFGLDLVKNSKISFDISNSNFKVQKN